MEKINIDLLRENTDNPRKISEVNFERLKKSIVDFPEMLSLRPLVVDENFVLLGGNQRLRALRELGHTEAFVVFAENLSEEQKKEFLIKDNANFGEWDFADFDFGGLSLEDFRQWGDDVFFKKNTFGLHQFAEEYGGKKNNTTNPMQEEEEMEVKILSQEVEIGDMFAIGRHRLLCGDVTNQEDIDYIVDGEKADLFFGDPPYGMRKEGVIGDDANSKEILEFYKKWVGKSFDILKPHAAWYCWGNDLSLLNLYSEVLFDKIADKQVTFKNFLTWSKVYTRGMSSSLFRKYPTASEKCIFLTKGDDSINNNSDNWNPLFEPLRKYIEKSIKDSFGSSQNARFFLGHSVTEGDSRCHWTTTSQFQLISEKNYAILKQEARRRDASSTSFSVPWLKLKKKYEKARKPWIENQPGIYLDNAHDNMTDVWVFDDYKRDKEAYGYNHATPKPLALCQRVILTSCPQDGLVVDFFCGTGSTIISAQKENRRVKAVEISQENCRSILSRFLHYFPNVEIKKISNV